MAGGGGGRVGRDDDAGGGAPETARPSWRASAGDNAPPGRAPAAGLAPGACGRGGQRRARGGGRAAAEEISGEARSPRRQRSPGRAGHRRARCAARQSDARTRLATGGRVRGRRRGRGGALLRLLDRFHELRVRDAALARLSRVGARVNAVKTCAGGKARVGSRAREKRPRISPPRRPPRPPERAPRAPRTIKLHVSKLAHCGRALALSGQDGSARPAAHTPRPHPTRPSHAAGPPAACSPPPPARAPARRRDATHCPSPLDGRETSLGSCASAAQRSLGGTCHPRRRQDSLVGCIQSRLHGSSCHTAQRTTSSTGR